MPSSDVSDESTPQQAVQTRLLGAANDRLDCGLAFAQPAGMPILLPCRFAAVSEPSVQLVCGSEHLPNLHGKVSLGAAVTANFRIGPDDVFFCTHLERFEPGPTPREVGLRLALPAELITTQRRKSFRVYVTAEDAIAVRLWRVNDYVLIRDTPKPSQELSCTLRDLSTGGLRALVRAPRLKALALVENQRFRVELTATGSTSMLFEGRLRYPRQSGRDDAEAVCGIRFVHRDGDIESRRNLQKLQVVLGHIQRQAAARRGSVTGAAA